MKRISKVTLVLIVVMALPVIAFYTRSINELSDNEAMVQKVFDKQLQSMLYSLNQYTETLFGLWSARLDLAYNLDYEDMSEAASEVMLKNPSIVAISYDKANTGETIASIGNMEHHIVNETKPDSSMVEQLVEFIGQGYQKIASSETQDGALLYFLLSKSNDPILCKVWIDPQIFFNRSMSQVIQQASQDMFYITITNSLEGTTIDSYSDTANVSNDWTASQELWYFPNYKFNIKLKSKTIDEIVADRSQKNNILILITLVIVLIGGGFVVFSIRREMHLAEMKSDFVSSVSHELRTPLALMSMYVEMLMLKRYKDQAKEEEYIKIVYSETQRLSGMVNRILNFSRMERGKREYHITPYSVNQLIEEVISLYQPNFKDNNVDVSVSMLPQDTTIGIDHEALTETLVNLFDNAINYGKDNDKKIAIRASIKHNSVIIEVEDNGIGISPKHQKKIFDKFYRVTKKDLAHKAKGSGIGLNIVREIIRHHNGKVSVKSQLGEGSCFILQLPVK